MESSTGRCIDLHTDLDLADGGELGAAVVAEVDVLDGGRLDHGQLTGGAPAAGGAWQQVAPR